MVLTMEAGHRERKWSWFGAWMLPGACLAFAVTALGVFVVPVGLLLALGLLRRRPGIESLGLLAGLGAIVAWIGSLNLDYRACLSNSVSLSLPRGATRSAVYSCGGVNGARWMIVGVSAVVAVLMLYLVATRSAPPTGADPCVAQPSPS
jgi:hypothetical protein